MPETIVQVIAREILDSRGNPTVEVDVETNSGFGRAAVPSGASTGEHEAFELRDGDAQRFLGKGVQQAVGNVNDKLGPAITGLSALDQAGIDERLLETDGTPNKSKLGANAVLGVSMAVARAAADTIGVPLWRYLAGDRVPAFLPLPEVQIFGGGAHAGRRVDVQDFMVTAVGAASYTQALDWTAEVYRAAGRLMSDAGLAAGVADEGGYWPAFDDNEQALTFLVRAIEAAGLRPGEDMAISLDIAATDFGRGGRYHLAREDREVGTGELADMLAGWLKRYPVVAIEDPLGEDDVEGMAAFTDRAGAGVQVVADDFICTDASKVRAAEAAGACNTALIKPNQAGTLTETYLALQAARDAGWDAIVSARSGETEDVTIVHLAVGWGVKQLKVGSFARSERMAKWNEGLRLAEALGQGEGALAPRSAFPWG